MKTVLIYDQCGQEDVKFVVIDKDVSHLDGIYINNSENSMELVNELCDLLYANNGDKLVKFSEKFPTQDVIDGAKVIVCGFFP